MLAYYFVKQDLFGVPAGHVERFALHKAGALVMQGAIEPYDQKNKKHREAPGSPESDARARADRDRRDAERRRAAAK